MEENEQNQGQRERSNETESIAKIACQHRGGPGQRQQDEGSHEPSREPEHL
jgi:hypothetical protein